MKRVALLLGINNYRDPGIQDLQCAGSDAQAVKETLDEHGFETHLLCDEKVILNNVTGKIKEICQQLRSGTCSFSIFQGTAMRSVTIIICCVTVQPEILWISMPAEMPSLLPLFAVSVSLAVKQAYTVFSFLTAAGAPFLPEQKGERALVLPEEVLNLWLKMTMAVTFPLLFCVPAVRGSRLMKIKHVDMVSFPLLCLMQYSRKRFAALKLFWDQ
jgi:hypothetical protein